MIKTFKELRTAMLALGWRVVPLKAGFHVWKKDQARPENGNTASPLKGIV